MTDHCAHIVVPSWADDMESLFRSFDLAGDGIVCLYFFCFLILSADRAGVISAAELRDGLISLSQVDTRSIRQSEEGGGGEIV